MTSATSRTRVLALAALAAACAVATAPAFAQRASLAERVAALEQRAANSQGNMALVNQLEQLRSEVATLRSMIEELRNEGEQAKATARAQYLDLDGRLTRLEGGGQPVPAAPAERGVESSAALQATPDSPPLGGVSPPDIVMPPTSADERASYESAFDILKAGRYDESARAFVQFLQAHPDGSYAPNARYWLGESYYVTGNYQLALEQFQLLYRQHPQHAKAPGALLKVGLSQYGLQQMGEAEATLTEVTRKYPGTDAARTAEDRLQAIALRMP